MGRSSQRKGRAGEIELANILERCGIKAAPGPPLNYGTVPDVIGIDGIHAEVKRVERLNVPAAMEQSIRDSEKFQDGVPALFHRRNRGKWLVTMRLGDWVQMYSRWGGKHESEKNMGSETAENQGSDSQNVPASPGRSHHVTR